jgi:hypothetical protein
MADILYGPVTVYRIPRPGEAVKMWSITLRVLESGTIEATSVTGGIPPGEIEVRGHDDGNRVTLHVRQRDEDGRFVTSAQHTRDRAEEALEEAEELAQAVAEDGGQAVVSDYSTQGAYRAGAPGGPAYGADEISG